MYRYRIHCGSRSAIYNKQTGRTFKARLGEHFDTVANDKPEQSNFAVQVLSAKYLITKCSFHLLHTLSKGERISFKNIKIIRALADLKSISGK